MRKYLSIVLSMIFVFGLVGCNTTTHITDVASDAISTPNVSGIELSEEIIELEVKSQVDEPQITDENILTNTTQITVSADHVPDDVEVSLFLYIADDFDTPTGYATLTRKDNSVDFTNLTSSCEYRIGAKIENANATVVLTITD